MSIVIHCLFATILQHYQFQGLKGSKGIKASCRFAAILLSYLNDEIALKKDFFFLTAVHELS